MAHIDNSELKHLREMAIQFARKRYKCNLQTAEDFAQEYVTAVWLGETQNLLWQISNFFRRQRGRGGKKIVFNDETFEYSYTPDLSIRLQIIDMINFIDMVEDKRLRMMLKLYMHDVPQQDIAEIFDITPARVSQMFKKALQDLRKQFNKK